MQKFPKEGKICYRLLVACHMTLGLHICAIGTEHGLLQYFEKSRKIGEDSVSSQMQISLYCEWHEFHKAQQFATMHVGHGTGQNFC